MKRIYTVLWSLLLLSCMTMQARQLSIDEALARVKSSKVAKARNLTQQKPELVYTSSVGNINCFYVVNHGEDRGFMVLSADDCAPAILGYVDNGSFDPVNIPANFAYFLDRYTQRIASATRMNSNLAYKAPESWSYIPTLIDARWNQGEPYNRLCTDYTVLKEPVVTGCVATAIAQIMRQYEWPVRGTGSYSYTTSCEIDGKKYEVHPSADFDVEYEWDKMLFDYNNGYTDEQGDAVALLMRHVGVACNMGYSPSGSGAGTDNPIYALTTHFGYDKNMKIQYLSDYTDDTFAKLLYDELAEGRAMYAAGNGHAFLCDGYDGEGYFHWNWGWGGSMDGYFMLVGDHAVGGFRDGLCAIIGIQPDKGGKSPVNMTIDNYKLSVDRITDYSQSVNFDGFMVNRSKRKARMMYAFRFVNESGETYLVPGRCTELDHNYGLLPFDFQCQNVPNGTYKVYPCYRNLEVGTWHFPSCTPEEGVPTLTIDVPEFHIYTAEDLVALREQVSNGVNGCVKIMNDIDMSSVCGKTVGSWKTIGSEAKPFKGRVEGNGHVISNLFIRNTNRFQGLFGAVGQGFYINGLTMDETCAVRGGNFVGGIVGGSVGGGFVTIENCGNEGTVYAQQNAAGIIGSCYGSNANFILTNCYNAGIITGSMENAAISGWVGNYACIENCYNAARVGGHDGKNSFVRYGDKLFMQNCYQLNTVVPRQAKITLVKRTAISSGELTYLLNDLGTKDNWFQNLDTTQVADEHPVLANGHPWVYALTDSTYGNEPNDLAIIKDGEEYVQDSARYYSQVRYSREFTQTEAWEPLFVPFPSAKKDWGADVQIAKLVGIHHYDDNGDGVMDRIDMEAATLTDTDSVKANMPYLILSANADTLGMALHRSMLMPSQGFAPAWCANALVKFCLQGVYTPYVPDVKDYVLSGNALTNNASETVLPLRWYMYLDSREEDKSAIRHISLTIDGQISTGIGHVVTGSLGGRTYFDLLGRPINQPGKGVFIHQGRKVLY